MIFFPSDVPIPPAGFCVVVTDPNVDPTLPKSKCGAATSGKTVLDWPICDECFSEVCL